MRLTVTRIAVHTTNSSAAKCRKLIPTIHDHTLPAGRWVLPSSSPKRPAPSTNPVHSAARAPGPFMSKRLNGTGALAALWTGFVLGAGRLGLELGNTNLPAASRSEERRVGKWCRARWDAYHSQKK